MNSGHAEPRHSYVNINFCPAEGPTSDPSTPRSSPSGEQNVTPKPRGPRSEISTDRPEPHVIKANCGLYAWKPGTALSESVNNNRRWYNQYAWTAQTATLYDWRRRADHRPRGGAASGVPCENQKNHDERI